MSTLDPLDRMFAAARRDVAPPVDVVGRVLVALPRQAQVMVVPEVDWSEWIGAGASTLVAACCLWLVMPLWHSTWPSAMSVWHPLAAMLQQLQ